MEWLLLLLLGGLAAGSVYFTSKPRSTDSSVSSGTSPQSGPPVAQSDEKAPVIDVSSTDLDKFKNLLSKAPDPIEPKVIEATDKSAKEKADELKKEMRRKKSPLKISYPTDQIIPRSSPFAFHRRPLQSAEQFVEQQLADEALKLYERVDKRIENEEINRKIQTNIEDIKKWIEGIDEGDDDEPITFPEIIIPLTTQALAIENLNEGLRKLTETLSRDIASAFRQPIQIAEQPAQESSPQSQPSPDTAFKPQAVPQSPQPSPNDIYTTPPPTTFKGDTASGIPPITIYRQVIPVGPSVTTGPSDYFKHASDEFQFNKQGELITDGRTDEDFEREWDKYKRLPLTDRRSGQERRDGDDNTEEEADRRSRTDRRKNDLFLERDEFLESWKKHEERKRLLEQRGALALHDEDQTDRPYLPGLSVPPPAFDPIGLPDADEHPLDKALQEAGSLIDQIQVESTPSTAGASPTLPEDLPSLSLPDAHLEKPEPFTQHTEPPPISSAIEIVASSLDALQLPDATTKDLPGPQQPYLPPSRQQSLTEPADTNLPEPQLDQTEQALPESKPAEAPKPQEPFGEGVESADIPDIPDLPEESGPIQEIRGVLELKPPDEDDAPFLTLTYDFGKIPDSFKLSRDYHTMEFVYYKYKPMLIKAQEFARRKMLKSALNYYRVIKSQNIPPEFRRMVNRNIQDITDYLEKFMMSRSGD